MVSQGMINALSSLIKTQNIAKNLPFSGGKHTVEGNNYLKGVKLWYSIITVYRAEYGAYHVQNLNTQRQSQTI